MDYSNFKICTLFGFSGSGKSEQIVRLKNEGEQVVSIEEIAGIKGVCLRNLFGQLDIAKDEIAVSIQKLFESFDPEKTVWVEWKPVSVHRIELPQKFVEVVYSNTAFVLTTQFEARLKRILLDYQELKQHLEYFVSGFESAGIFNTKQMACMKNFEIANDAEGMFRFILREFLDPQYCNEIRSFKSICYGYFVEDRFYEIFMQGNNQTYCGDSRCLGCTVSRECSFL